MTQPRRGRPPKTEAEQEKLRGRVIRATAIVFGRRGYHGLTVEEILEEAGISRPTFYAHFQNVDEPVETVLEQANGALIAVIRRATALSSGGEDVLVFALDAYLAWGESMGPLLRPLYAELHDPLSPVSRHRTRALRTLRHVVTEATSASARPRPTPLVVDLLISGLEYLGYRYHLASKRDRATRLETRDAMARLALATLGGADDWSMVARTTDESGMLLADESSQSELDSKPAPKAGVSRKRR